jgi:ABC-type uncharacterized transport system fused permease/ATPase subunit
MDEATSAIDESTQSHLLKLVHESGSTMICVSHNSATRDLFDTFVTFNGNGECRVSHRQDIDINDDALDKAVLRDPWSVSDE